MSKVHISSQAHEVTVDHDGGDLSYVIEKAQKLWNDTRPPERDPGPAFGFSAERDRGLSVGWNKRRGGEFDPIRVEQRDA